MADQERFMDEQRARALVARERRRVEAALAELTGEEQGEVASQFDQTGESAEAGAEIQHEMVDSAMAATLQSELASVVRAETRIAQGTFGVSVESGARIPDDRLEIEPLAERTVEEQSRFERSLQ
jgi:RNA polymerase-binding transcription factor DksA